MTPAVIEHRPGRTRWSHRVLLLLGALALLLMSAGMTAAPANAAAAEPVRAQSWMTCDPPPKVDLPNQGISGGLDPTSLGRGIVVFTDDAMDSWIERGYAGTIWYTHGYSGPCALSDPWVPTENAIAGEIFNVAKVLTALTNYVHTFLADDIAKIGPAHLRDESAVGTGAAVFDQIEDLVQKASTQLYHSVYAPYIGLAVLLSSVMLLVYALKGNLASSSKRVLWIFAGMTAATLTYTTPLTFLAVSDSFVNEAATLESRIVTDYRGAVNHDPRHSLPMLLYKHTVYQPWLVGEFGAHDNAEAAKFGKDLLKAQSCTLAEVKNNACGPDQIKQKQTDWSELAKKIEASPAAAMFSGANGRLSAGFQALGAAIAFDLIPLVAKAGVVLALIIIRMLVLVGPIIGVVAVVNNGALPKVLRALGGALVHALILLVGSSVHVLVLAWTTDPARGFSPLTRVLIMLVVTVVAWTSLRPIERLQQMVAGAVNGRVPSANEMLLARHMRYERRRRWMRRARMVAGLGPDFRKHWFSGSGGETATSTAEGAPAKWNAERLRPETVNERRPLPGPGGGGGGGGLPPGSPPPPLPQPVKPRGPRPSSGGGAAARPPEQPARPHGGGRPGLPPGSPQGPVPPVYRPDGGGGAARPEPRVVQPINAPRDAAGVYKVSDIWDPSLPTRERAVVHRPTPRQSPNRRNGPNVSHWGRPARYDTAATPHRPENRPGGR